MDKVLLSAERRRADCGRGRAAHEAVQSVGAGTRDLSDLVEEKTRVLGLAGGPPGSFAEVVAVYTALLEQTGKAMAAPVLHASTGSGAVDVGFVSAVDTVASFGDKGRKLAATFVAVWNGLVGELAVARSAGQVSGESAVLARVVGLLSKVELAAADPGRLGAKAPSGSPPHSQPAVAEVGIGQGFVEAVNQFAATGRLTWQQTNASVVAWNGIAHDVAQLTLRVKSGDTQASTQLGAALARAARLIDWTRGVYVAGGGAGSGAVGGAVGGAGSGAGGGDRMPRLLDWLLGVYERAGWLRLVDGDVASSWRGGNFPVGPPDDEERVRLIAAALAELVANTRLTEIFGPNGPTS